MGEHRQSAVYRMLKVSGFSLLLHADVCNCVDGAPLHVLCYRCHKDVSRLKQRWVTTDATDIIRLSFAVEAQSHMLSCCVGIPGAAPHLVVLTKATYPLPLLFQGWLAVNLRGGSHRPRAPSFP